MTVNEAVAEYLARNPDAPNAEVAEYVRKVIPGAKTTASSVSSVKTRSRGGDAPKKAPADAPRKAAKPKKKHVLPGHVVQATLAQHGVDSVNTATEWAAVNGITPSRIVAIVRGKRPTVTERDADEIALALNLPELWQTDWADWAEQPLTPGDRVDYIRTGVVVRVIDGGANCVVAIDGREIVVPRRRLAMAS